MGYKRCYETHPIVTLDQCLTIHGGSCMYPVIDNAMVYVGLDMNTRYKINQIEKGGGQYLDAYIPNMGVPNSVKEFRKLVHQLADMVMVEGMSLHIGCIGGHGRTGMVLAALQRIINDDPYATEYIRKHYCVKAVESQLQIDWLHQHFAIAKVAPVPSKYAINPYHDSDIVFIDK